MGNTPNSYGKPVYDDGFALPADLQDGVDFADEFANVRVGTAADRSALTAGQLRTGMLFTETDTDTVWAYYDAAWSRVFTKAQSYSPTLSGMTLGSGGSVTAKVGVAGGMFWMTFDITLGSGFGFTDPNISVPAWADHAHLPPTMYLGEVGLLDVSATTLGRYLGGAHQGGSSTTLRILRQATNNVLPITSNTDPFAWAAGDRIVGNVRYPVA